MNEPAYGIGVRRFRLLERGVESKTYALQYENCLGFWRTVYGSGIAKHLDTPLTFKSIKEARDWVKHWYGERAYVLHGEWRVA